MGPHRSKPLNQHAHLGACGDLQVAELGQDSQAFDFSQQRVDGDDHPAGCCAQLVNPVAAHVGWFGQGTVEPVFDGDGLHIGVVGAYVGTGQVQVTVAVDEMRKATNHLGVLLRR